MLPFNKVLVTGGAGFIGSHIVDRLIQENCEVTILDDFSSGNLANLRDTSTSKNLVLLKGDVNDESLLKRAVKDTEVIFHQASIVSVQRSMREPELTNHVNVDGTANVLRAAINSKVDRFVLASSAAVYGNCADLPLKTTSPVIPISPYGTSKLSAEQLCLESYKMSGLGVSILRYFNVYGPRSLTGEYSSVINKFMERIANFESPIINGNGEATRDFIYVKDIALANLLAASNRKSVGKIYNVGSGVKVSINEVAACVLKILLGPNVLLPFEYVPRSSQDIVHSYGDVSLIKNDLKFETQYSLEDGLNEYFRTLWTSLPLRIQNIERLTVQMA